MTSSPRVKAKTTPVPKSLTPLQQHHRRKAIYRALVADFGGEENLSTLQTGLLQQAAIVLLRSELAAIAIARGEAIDEARFSADTALAIRVLRCLGSRSANVKMSEPEETLQSYLAKRDAEKALENESAVGGVSDAPAGALVPIATPARERQDEASA